MEPASLIATPAARDRRVRRSRSALLRAAVALVSERETTSISISDIAEAAEVSRPVVYQRFGDRDSLLIEAALDLARRELLPRLEEAPGRAAPADRRRAADLARHFAENRPFYRAMLTGSCAFALNQVLTALLLPLNQQIVRQLAGDGLDQQVVADLAAFLTGGSAAIVNEWVINGEDPLEPEQLADRLMRAISALTSGAAVIPANPPSQEPAP